MISVHADCRHLPKADTPHILCINPWIHDFAAYDFWAKPLGLLTLAAICRLHGCRVSYLDCLDRFHPRAPHADPFLRYGRGPYLKTPIPKPPGLSDVRRRYCRYGIRPQWLLSDLRALPRPDLILVTSLMTYWYPGLQETVRLLRTVFPETPVLVGGIYATLCSDHCRSQIDADEVVTGGGEALLLDLIGKYTGHRATLQFDPQQLDSYPYPALDLQHCVNYVPLLTSKGCPFSCAYCASRRLNPNRITRNPEAVAEEIGFWHAAHGVKDFIFYDDALLMDMETHAGPIFEAVASSGINVRFHTPNALHIRWIDSKAARLMKRAGFETIRLGLETAGFGDRRKFDWKVTATEFHSAVACLNKAGFTARQIGVYLLVGLPGQKTTSIEASIQIVRRSGATPILATYSPIPHTALWPQAVAASRYDLKADPVFCNNAVMPCQRETFSWQRLSHLKQLAAATA
ncbi:MAG: radical SAM protein [Deltaproteobacteria bacterium SG8_13]|nr:MAG: radical SAM protein [Deltaproteobacteria bacterium SG8_13]